MAAFASKWFPLLVIELLLAGAVLIYVFTLKPSCSVSKTQSESGVSLDLGLNYGNSTASSWKSMLVPVCATLYDAMELAGWKLDTKWYGSLGAFVIGINGVEHSGTSFWQWYSWTGSQWSLGQVGASSDIIKGGDMILWFFGASTPSSALQPPSLLGDHS